MIAGVPIRVPTAIERNTRHPSRGLARFQLDTDSLSDSDRSKISSALTESPLAYSDQIDAVDLVQIRQVESFQQLDVVDLQFDVDWLMKSLCSAPAPSVTPPRSTGSVDVPWADIFFDFSYIRPRNTHLEGQSNRILIGRLMNPRLSEVLKLGPIPRPNPLFDPEDYLAQNPGVAAADMNPIYHFIMHGAAEGRPIHSLFDRGHVAAQLGADPSDSKLWQKYLIACKDVPLSLHPLIDPRWIAAQDGAAPAEQACAAFLYGEIDGHISPHVLFDLEFYRDRTRIDFSTGVQALQHYLGGLGHVDPVYLFKRDYYREQAGVPIGEEPIVHFLRHGADSVTSTHPAFDIQYYMDQAAALSIKIDCHPLLHYFREGRTRGLNPIRLFDEEYYRSVSGYDGPNPLGDYFLHSYRRFSPSPAVDLAYVRSACSNFTESSEFIDWFYSHPEGRRPSTHSRFSPKSYLKRHEDIRVNNRCPVTHFVEWGVRENRWPNDLFSPRYVQRALRDQPLPKEGEVYAYFRSNLAKRPRLLFVSHDGSLTGAPAIILRLLNEFADSGLFECCTIMDEGGPRLEDFQRAGPVYIMRNGARAVGWDSDDPVTELVQLFDDLAGEAPIFAFVNSVESRHIGRALARSAIPIAMLIHEAAFFYKPETFLEIYGWSDRVVLPSNYVRHEAEKFVFDDSGKVVVRGQGLLTATFGRLDRERARVEVCDELGISPDARIVLGCGSIDQRKGIDYFVAVARRYLMEADRTASPTYFIWIGDGARWSNTPYHYAMLEAQLYDVDDRVRFIGPRLNVEPYFAAADAFLMTARADPFPCVVHEAMAAGLPVIGFDRAGGAPELYGRHGKTVAFGDVDAMAGALGSVLSDEPLRRAMGREGAECIKRDWAFHDYYRFFLGVIDEHLNTRFSETAPVAEASSPKVYLLEDLRDPGSGEILAYVRDELTSKGVPAVVYSAAGGLRGPGGVIDDADDRQRTFLNWFDWSEASLVDLLKRIDETTGGVVVVPAAGLARLGKVTGSARIALAAVATSPTRDRALLEEHSSRLSSVIAPSSDAALLLRDLDPGLGTRVVVSDALHRRIPAGMGIGSRIFLSLLDEDAPAGELLSRAMQFIAHIRRAGLASRFVVLVRRLAPEALKVVAQRLQRSLGEADTELRIVDNHGQWVDGMDPADTFVALGAVDRIPTGLVKAMHKGAFVVVATRCPWLRDQLADDGSGIGFEPVNLEAALRRYIEVVQHPSQPEVEYARHDLDEVHVALQGLLARAAVGAIGAP